MIHISNRVLNIRHKSFALQKVGCDWVIDSDAIEDKCGICRGDGTKCSPVEGEFTEAVPLSGKISVDCARGLPDGIEKFLLSRYITHLSS